MKPTLLILAAGMGSRYGGLKQVDPVGPSGETILDYSVYDAIRASFGKVVFVIRKDIEKDFLNKYINHFRKHIEVDWVFQETNKLPEEFTAPTERTKPWGTGHAVLMAADKINEPFAVINADDFYGREAFITLSRYFEKSQVTQKTEYAMVAYELNNTLSDFGTVSRGICIADDSGQLQSVTERTSIQEKNGKIIFIDEQGVVYPLNADVPVSMNFWGFRPDYFGHLKTHFIEFLKKNINNPKSEFYIPSVVDDLIKSEVVNVKLLRNSGQWFGITYREDKPDVINKINNLIEAGVYPSRLWDINE